VALHILWQDLKSHRELMESPPARLSALIRTSATAALDRTLGRRQTGAIEQFRVLEQARLERLLEQWLQVERGRQPFRVVETETAADVVLAGLHRVRPTAWISTSRPADTPSSTTRPRRC
jgi:hypothetical protein